MARSKEFSDFDLNNGVDDFIEDLHRINEEENSEGDSVAKDAVDANEDEIEQQNPDVEDDYWGSCDYGSID